MSVELFTDDDGHLCAQYSIAARHVYAAPIVAKIIADSITEGGCRLVTWVWEYPRFIHAEIMTHRVLSRNAASSRAIPAKKLRERTADLPVVPVSWGANQAGMQATSEVDNKLAAELWWRRGLMMAADHHEEGERLGLHKQIVNRVLEPYMSIAVIVSATDHANFFHLRKHKDAEPNFQVLATLVWELFHNHMPTPIPVGGWHIPFVGSDDLQWAKSTVDLIKLSVGRCARVSYLTHEGKRDRQADIDLHDKLIVQEPAHASPAEHQALAMGLRIGGARQHFANFEGWQQYRRQLPSEAGPNTSIRCKRCGCWADRHVAGCSNMSLQVGPPMTDEEIIENANQVYDHE